MILLRFIPLLSVPLLPLSCLAAAGPSQARHMQASVAPGPTHHHPSDEQRRQYMFQLFTSIIRHRERMRDHFTAQLRTRQGNPVLRQQWRNFHNEVQRYQREFRHLQTQDLSPETIEAYIRRYQATVPHRR